MVGHEIHDLLRRAGAFDRHGRLCEQSGAATKALDQLPGILGGVGPIIAADTIASQRVRQALDGVPIDLEAGAGDEEVIADLPAVREPDQTLFRMKACRRGPDPRHAFRDQLFLAPFGLLAAEDAGADQRPARLVPVKLRRLDNCDVEVRVMALQLRRDRDAGGAATDDYHGVVHFCGTCRALSLHHCVHGILRCLLALLSLAIFHF